MLRQLLPTATFLLLAIGITDRVRCENSQSDLGAQIYADRCAVCHGDEGEGVSGAYEMPLIGDAPMSELVTRISETMPQDAPGTCVGADAEAVATYMQRQFYSEAAQVRRNPPRQRVARLTATQLRNSLADLYAHFQSEMPALDTPGLTGRYYAGTNRNDDNKKIERIDRMIDFDFGHAGPGDGISGDDFAIQWNGALSPDTTGSHEIVIRSSCAFMCYLGDGDREFINNHVQSGDQTEFRRSIVLTGGRVYPIRIEFYQRKRKTEQPPASFSLSWVAPGQVERLLPSRNLRAVDVPATFSLQTKLPPDDRSYGYERGIAVDRPWDEATTAAAVEFAETVAHDLWARRQGGGRGRGRRRNRDQQASELVGRDAMRTFLLEFVETAFRGPLDEETIATYVDQQLAATSDDAEAITRVVLMTLKSPRFFYPLIDNDKSQSQRVANRLALYLHDSLPSDPWLVALVDENGLDQESAVRDAATRMVSDYRTRGKMREFLYAWLNVDPGRELTKSSESFPDFDGAVKNDIRESFDAFLDDIVWSEASDYRQLLLADWSYTNARLQSFYGAAWAPANGGEIRGEGEADGGAASSDLGQTLVRSVSHSEQHVGVLTHPYLMSMLAYHDTSSPIHRGVFLIRHLLGRTLRPPQAAFAPLSPDLHPELTTRDRVTLQTSPTECQSCHAKINGLGFALENFDAVGRYRVEERSRSIDATGRYRTRGDDLVEFNGAREFANSVALSEDTCRAFVDRAFEHFVKQPAAAYGPDTLDQLLQKFIAADYNIRQLLVEIAVVAATEPPSPE